MPKIKILSEDLVNKIAAGEVVERPASALKELIENSLDAGAETISVEAEEGGINFLRVVDDGSGMDREDLAMSIFPHSTSKISKIEDFDTLLSYGFRGEALASISAVSRFTIESKQNGEREGARLHKKTDESNSWDIEPSACAPGTSVTIADLFYNIPARRKFLKSVGTEYLRLVEVITQAGLLRPDSAFSFTYNKKKLFDWKRTPDWRQRVADILGPGAEDMVGCNSGKYEVRVGGFICRPTSGAFNRRKQFLYINGRWVSDYRIAAIIKEAYGVNMPHDRFPVFVLRLDMRPDWVDANVHPRKIEVRFKYTEQVYRCVYRVVQDTLARSGLLPVAGKVVEGDTSAEEFEGPRFVSLQSFPIFEKIFSKTQFSQNVFRSDSATPGITEGGSGRFICKVIGQIRNSYIIAENNEGILMVDQHAAAERVLYEKLKSRVSQDKIQNLLIPKVLHLGASEFSWIVENLPLLAESGFVVEEFGSGTVRILGVPYQLSRKDPGELLLEVTKDVLDSDWSRLGSLEAKLDHLYKIASCRGSVKFNHSLTFPEMESLLGDLERFNLFSCPHGRPVSVLLQWQQLEKMFGRI
ncbi:MAG: DNA mismatch repair protein MutL [Parcubacteria group bacterium Gr01-1014_18]|nr:MAG: DNA mismatch repair protein MutL [Parcubacteria group bacterium Greene0416_36]TSC81043.1 MAG: DNA mismatch repair protein MutL [Parcubacteria group bacterium Gr01-1014_18]TSC98965.1 MAG: DNA mismatch repair protein MutL [Parcubacteria group bacterium Greene1014_20]TSD06743.1 MAG: DNA mismatch repair protein MutL [Parcubacteria group bacterium Greene0714_2]